MKSLGMLVGYYRKQIYLYRGSDDRSKGGGGYLNGKTREHSLPFIFVPQPIIRIVPLTSDLFLFCFIQLTHADILFFDFFNNFLGKGKPEDPKYFSKFTKLEEHYKEVRDFPGIKTWLEKRPITNL